VTKQIKDKYGKDVRFDFRQYPLSIHADARLAAEASLAANAQGKFWQFHDLLFKNPTDLSRSALEAHAKQAGLDLNAFKKALDDKTYAAAVDADMKLGDEAQVQGTPTLFLNGERVANAGSFEALSAQIDAALKAPG
jgi:protein-disulfide isomerase